MRSLIACGRSFVDSLCTITVTSGDAFKARIYDNKRATRYGSSGSAEGVAVTVLVEFKDRMGTAASRTIDRLILLNHNLKNFYVEYWDGAAWQSIAESVFTTNAAADLYIEMAAPVSTTKIRLTATHTIGAVAEKLIGEFMACLFVVALRHVTPIERRDWDDGGDYRLDGGPLVSFMRFTKFEAKVSLEQMTLASYELIEPLLRTRATMVWILYSDFRAADIYQLTCTTQPQTKIDRKMQLYSLSFDVKER